MLQLGSLTVEALDDGAFALDGGAMFGVVPRPLWEKQHPADAQNRIRLALRCLLVRSPGRVALVDTGMGEKWDERGVAMYAVERQASLLGELAARGLAAEDVTDVLLTHLHFDHAGSVTRRRPDGALTLTFPRARHHLQRRNWDWAHDPSPRDRGSYRAENFSLLEGSPLLSLVDGPAQLWPGVSVLPSDGHTIGLQIPRLEGGGRSLLYPADVIPTAAHLKAAWGMSYDLQPLRLLDEKRALLARAAAEGSVLVFEHDPRRAACTVRAERDEFVLDSEVAL